MKVDYEDYIPYRRRKRILNNCHLIQGYTFVAVGDEENKDFVFIGSENKAVFPIIPGDSLIKSQGW